jgi:hypothetical protein
MSIVPEIVHTLNDLQRQIASVKDPNTAIMLIPETYLTTSNSNTQLIHMDSNFLPPIQEFTMFPSSSNERTFMGNYINSDFIYEPTHSSNDGIKSDFHLIGDPGMFLVGPRFYFNSQNLNATFKTVIDVTVSANGTDIGEVPVILQGNQKEHIFLSQGDNFRIRYDPVMNPDIDNTIQIYPYSEFTITRISRNPDYVSPFVYLIL